MEGMLRIGLPLGASGLMEEEAAPGRDLFVVAKCLVPTDAYLVQGCLVASGIPAVVADANHVQADLLMAPALGGVRILVPASWLDEARRVLDAFERGAFALGDDADVGEAE
ncbi:MAG: putative signal transducing protein [Telluria sp.]